MLLPPSLYTLGGSGENGRNCYLLSSPGGCVLLDCGVKRVVTDSSVGEYPLLTREIASRVQAVFLSHAHEDHCAALPLLYALGYTGLVYGSEETLAKTPRMIEKWMAFVEARGGRLPYTPEDVKRIRYAPLALGESRLSGLRLLTGRSGHTVGSMWLALGWEKSGWQFFYSGDMCTSALSLAFDAPPPCGFALLNCAYAGSRLVQAEQYGALVQQAKEVLARRGTLLLPVPPTGRGCDMLLHLAAHVPDAPIFSSKAIVNNASAMLANRKWLRQNASGGEGLRRVVPLDAGADYAAACSGGPGILLVTDGMLTTAEGQLCLRLLSGGAENRVILTGHAAPGTPGGNLLDSHWRKAHPMPIQAGRLTIKVHLDDEDALCMQRSLRARHTVFFHAPQEHCASTMAGYAALGAASSCLLPGEGMRLPGDCFKSNGL